MIVIGAGAGGGMAACVLAEAGRRVLLVERGESLRRDDLPRDHLRNARVFTGLERQMDPPAVGNPRFVGDVLVGPTEPAWNNNAFAVGGGTRVYGGQAWRFCPEDFRMGSTYGEPFVDWPIDYEDLAPFYDRVEWEMGVCGPEALRPYDGARSRGYPMPPFAPNAAEPVLARGAEALGLATGPVPLLINSVPYGGRPACIRCGTCAGFACHADAKNGSQNTTVMRAVATGRCDLLTGAAATRLITQGSRVVGAELARAGRHITVRSGHVVVAAAAIETARLLLVSQVGTAHDQVGRYLQGHMYAGAVGVFDEPIQDCVGPGPSISTTDLRHHNDGILGGGILANEFVPIPIEAYMKLSGAGIVPAWGQAGAEAMRETYTRAQFVVGPVQEVPVGRRARHARAHRLRPQRHARRAPARRRPRAERRARRRVPRRARGGMAASQRGAHDPVVDVGAADRAQRGPAPGRLLPHGHRPPQLRDRYVGPRLGPRRRHDRRRLAARHQRRRQPGADHPRPRAAGQRAPRRRALSAYQRWWTCGAIRSS